MLNKTIKFFLENKLVTLILLIVFIGWGIMTAPFNWNTGIFPRDPVPVDAIPDIGENQQIVYTEWAGRSPQDIEDQVSYPLTTALLGIPGVKTIRSNSIFGVSSIYIIFEDNIHCSVQTNGSRYDMIFEIDLIGSQGRLKILNNGSSIELFKFEESNIYHGFKEQKIANTPAVKNTDVLKLAVLENVGIYEGARDNSVCSGYDGYQALEISSSLLESAKRKGEPRTLK